jgi:toxin ParE1/3/4
VASKRVSGRPSLSLAARQDIREILRWSERNFGEAAAARYRALVKQAIRDIGADPERPGSKERPELMIKGARTYHLSFSQGRVSGGRVKEPRHFLLYRRRHDDVIEVARILHDREIFFQPEKGDEQGNHNQQPPERVSKG